MLRITLIFSLLSILQPCLAQSNNVDSLIKILNGLKRDDTTKLAVLNEIAFAYTLSDLSKGNVMADSAIILAKKLKDEHGLANAFYSKGVNQSFANAHKEALNTFQKGLALYENLNDKEGVAKSLNYIGRSYYGIADQVKALEYGLNAFEIAKTLNNTELLGDIYNNLGNTYITSTNFYQALEFYLKALNAYEKTKYLNGIGKANVNIGNVYINMRQSIKGIKYLQRAYNIFTQTNYKRGMTFAIDNMGQAYYSLGRDEKTTYYFQKSLECFQQALKINEQIGTNLQRDFGNLGQLYNEVGSYDSAIIYLKKSLSYLESQNIKPWIGRTLTSLSNCILYASDEVLKKHGLKPSKRYSIALHYQYKAMALLQSPEDINHRDEGWDNLSLIFERQGRYDSALYAYKKFWAVNDSIYNIEKDNELTRKTMQYEFDKTQDSTKAANEKQQLLAAAELKQQKTTKNSILAGSGIVVLSGLLLFLSYKRRRDANTKRKDAELKAQIADTEMKVMRLQMNPHFIFNSLNSISDYIHKNNPQEADAYLSKFAKVMRMTLENSEQQSISLEDDLKTLELYMQLEAKRLNNKFTYEIKVADDIDQENTLVPPMIFQPFVENSIWHGIAKKEGQGHIIIDIKKENEMLYCIIDDDGIGRQATANVEPAKEKSSLGMKITKARIDILNKLKGSNATVQLIDKPQGLSAELKLPLETAF